MTTQLDLPQSHALETRYTSLSTTATAYAANAQRRLSLQAEVGWVTKALAARLTLASGMRLLNTGSSAIIDSLFLSQTYGVQVWTAGPRAAQEVPATYPVVEPPFPLAQDLFDIVINADLDYRLATTPQFLDEALRFVRPGGRIGLIIPGLQAESTTEIPHSLLDFWHPDFSYLHGPSWWRTHWERQKTLTVEHATLLPQSWRQWLCWRKLVAQENTTPYSHEVALIRRDAGRNLGCICLIARKAQG